MWKRQPVRFYRTLHAFLRVQLYERGTTEDLNRIRARTFVWRDLFSPVHQWFWFSNLYPFFSFLFLFLIVSFPANARNKCEKKMWLNVGVIFVSCCFKVQPQMLLSVPFAVCSKLSVLKIQSTSCFKYKKGPLKTLIGNIRVLHSQDVFID